MIEDEWNETPYFHVYNYYSEVADVDNSTPEVDVKLEEKYRVPISSAKRKNKPSYRHLIRLYCKSCSSNSGQDFPNDFSKTFICEKISCMGPLSFQCITCDNCYKHLASAYRHVRYSCKGLKNVIKTEVKTECDDRNSNTKVYNPYRRKNKKSVLGIDKKNEPFVCSKCDRVYKSINALQTHLKNFCGVEANIKCEFCSFKSKYKWNLKQHVENKHIKKEKVQQAQQQASVNVVKSRAKYVNRVRKRKRGRKTTKKTAISNWFSCEHCNYKAYRKDHLVVHLQKNHSEIFPPSLFTCKLCKKNCGDMYSFNFHMKHKCICKKVRVILSDITV